MPFEAASGRMDQGVERRIGGLHASNLPTSERSAYKLVPAPGRVAEARGAHRGGPARGGGDEVQVHGPQPRVEGEGTGRGVVAVVSLRGR
jgi:hypothetical protein